MATVVSPKKTKISLKEQIQHGRLGDGQNYDVKVIIIALLTSYSRIYYIWPISLQIVQVSDLLVPAKLSYKGKQGF